LANDFLARFIPSRSCLGLPKRKAESEAKTFISLSHFFFEGRRFEFLLIPRGLPSPIAITWPCTRKLRAKPANINSRVLRASLRSYKMELPRPGPLTASESLTVCSPRLGLRLHYRIMTHKNKLEFCSSTRAKRTEMSSQSTFQRLINSRACLIVCTKSFGGLQAEFDGNVWR
jgi:hypothetical protein